MAERLENADERMNFEIEKQIEVEENELFDDNGKPVVHLMHFNVRSSATLHWQAALTSMQQAGESEDEISVSELEEFRELLTDKAISFSTLIWLQISHQATAEKAPHQHLVHFQTETAGCFYCNYLHS